MAHDTLTTWLGKSKTRALVHVSLLTLGAVAVLAAELTFDLAASAFPAPDKAAHYQVGRIASTVVFLLVYVCILARVFLAQHRSITRTLIYIPLFLGIGLVLALLITFVLAIGKEVFDAGGMGQVEWADVLATLRGALTMVPAVAIVMALTPVFIPLDIIMQIPKLMRSDLKTGVGSVDQYLKADRAHKEEKKRGADVLLVEDDITCATVALNFFKHCKLTCHHVTSIKDGQAFLQLYAPGLRVVMLDNFVRLGDDGSNTTGSEWAMELHEQYPPEKRTFALILASGHIKMLGELEPYVDLIMQKPWSPRQLLAFLKERGVVPS